MSALFERTLGCVEQKLQCSQALLSIDNVELSNRGAARLEQLENHGTQKVAVDRLCPINQMTFRHPLDIAPQRSPLVFLVPHIRTLVGGNHVVLAPFEQLCRSCLARLLHRLVCSLSNCPVNAHRAEH